MADSGTDDRDERSERYSDRVSAPPPEFDDGPAGETRQTPKDELARWRRMAARGNDRSIEPQGPHAPNTPLEPGHDPASVTVPALDARLLDGHHEVTRAVANPLAPSSERPSAPMPWSPRMPEPPTRELQLSSDMVALSRPEPREPTGPLPSLPPRAPPPRPALRPLASSVPPVLPFVPDAPPLGVSASSLPPHSLAPASRGTSRWLAPAIAIGVIGLASAIAVAVVLWPDASDPLANPSTAPAPADPGTAVAPANPSTPADPSTPVLANPSTPAPAPADPSTSAPAPADPSTAVAPADPSTAVAPADPSTPAAPADPTNPAPGNPSTPAGGDPNPSTLDPDPEALVEEGDAAFEARDYAAALAAYQRAIALDPHQAHAFEGAARTCIALSRGEDAVRFAERAVAHRQRRASYRVLLGDAHRLAGHPAEARTAWRHALSLDPDDATARARLGE